MPIYFEPDKYDTADWLDVGAHDVEVVSHKLGYNNSGSRNMSVTFADDEGRQYVERYTLLDSVYFMLAKLFHACGHTSGLDLEDAQAVGRAIYSKPLTIELELGEPASNGKRYKQLKSVRARNSQRPSQSSQSSQPVYESQQGQDFGPPPDDSDIPF